MAIDPHPSRHSEYSWAYNTKTTCEADAVTKRVLKHFGVEE